MKKELLFIAIVPDEPVYSEIEDFKLEANLHFNTRAALKSPPHLTLHMPFQIKNVKLELLDKLLTDQSALWTKLNLQISGFSAFPPKVVFLNVLENQLLMDLRSSLVQTLMRELNIANADYRGLPFRPHFTIAFRDIKKIMFKDIIDYFSKKTYERVVKIESFHTLKHNGKYWELYKKYPFTSES